MIKVERWKVILETDVPHPKPGINNDILLAIAHSEIIANMIIAGYHGKAKVRKERCTFDMDQWLKLEGTT